MSNMEAAIFPSSSFSHFRKNQQYDSKWCIPLTELTFQSPEELEPLTVPQVPDEELDALKVKISHIRSEIQKEKVFFCTHHLFFLSAENLGGFRDMLPFQRANKGPKVIDRLRKKLCEQESLLLLMSPSMHLRVHNRNGKVATLARITLLFSYYFL